MPIKSNSNIDVSRYVAIGDSITSGYTDGALFYEGQLYAYANLLAQQFKLIGGGDFNQPLMYETSVGIGFYGNSKLVIDCKKQSGPFYIESCGDLAVFSENVFEKLGPFNNMSVPSAKLNSLVLSGLGNPSRGIGNFNPFFTRMASDPFSASILSDSLAINPTFFSLFIGNNDILTYASSGGTMDYITPLEGDIGTGFVSTLEYVVNELTKNGAKGIMANLADITNVPYFTVVPFDGLLLDEIEAKLLQKKYQEYNLTFVAGKNAFVIEDTKGVRQIEKGELIILDIQLDPNKEKYLKAELPIPKKYTLNLTEISAIQPTLNSYNEVIENLAKEKGLALVDVNAFTKTLKQEIIYNEINLSTLYSENSVFSLDGLHLNAFGQAMLANIFIKSINYTYHTQIELLDIMNFKNL
jgi:hypothetical protein